MRPLHASLVLAAALAGAHATAFAQATENSTIAESLFRDAQTRLTAGDLRGACDLFARSQRIEAALGTLLNLAMCHERDGKTATAWTEFQNALSWAVRNSDRAREQYARSHIAALDGRLHRIVIDVGEPLEGLQASLDGAPLPREAFGTAIPIDPGPHAIAIRATGKAPWVRQIDVGPAAGTERIEVKLEPVESAPTAAPVPAPAPAPAPGEPETVPPSEPTHPGATSPPGAAPVPSSDSSTYHQKRIAGFVVGSLGVASLGAAVAVAVKMAQYTSDRDALCPPGSPCTNQKAFDEDHAARLDQQWMLISGGVAVASLATGAVLLWTSRPSPDGRASAPRVDVAASTSGGALRLSGSW